ncbi:uncharacterized protein L3040_000882 [Drepanopeziza brunnea f. sp. 'multigermtubi']|uniref:uncharacterized protein n=1 Tax=Drepanopeziza brunnea f. sp. 'multigermtubi' TaxID=698441 RepID=UPI0023A75F4B|nr:hypothetical protein L3040_000882 [Drepanopeziza brunnea f. sp. 'multigermtubi']
MARSKSVFAILLVLSFFFNGAQAWFWRRKILIGYGVVSSKEAARINEKNKLRVEPFEYTSQLGPGFYIVNKASGYSYLEGDWFCAIKARKWKTKRVPKAYIPPSYVKKPSTRNRAQVHPSGVANKQIKLWGQKEEVFHEYLRTELSISEPEKALRFSWVKDIEWILQMNIPMDVVNNDDLDLWAKCFPTPEELWKYSKEVVDWPAWNIKGHPGNVRAPAKGRPVPKTKVGA